MYLTYMYIKIYHIQNRLYFKNYKSQKENHGLENICFTALRIFPINLAIFERTFFFCLQTWEIFTNSETLTSDTREPNG